VAIYVPPSTRRRRLVLLVVLGLVVGLVAGFGLGRATSSGIDDAVNKVRGHASDAATTLQRLPIEYEQAVAGSGGESTGTITEAIHRAQAELDAAWADASWFGPATRDPVDTAVDALDHFVAGHAAPAQFQSAVEAAVRAIERAFGITVGTD
jgi:hypothetical protein